MATASFYRTVAAGLDGLAADLDECASSGLQPTGDNLPSALAGDATAPLQTEYDAAAAGARRGAGTLRAAADWARREAARIEAAAAAAASAAGAAAAPIESPDTAVGPPPVFF